MSHSANGIQKQLKNRVGWLPPDPWSMDIKGCRINEALDLNNYNKKYKVQNQTFHNLPHMKHYTMELTQI